MSAWSDTSKNPKFSNYSHKRVIRGTSGWRQIIDQAYPLPPAPSDMCRDAFLAELLEPYKSISSTLTPSSEDSILSQKVRYETISDVVETYNVEAELLNRKQEGKRTSSVRRPSSMLASSTSGPDLNKLMRQRYDNIASAVGFMAVVSQLTQLKNCMLMFREMWKVQVTIDKDLRLFGWSIKDYFARFSQPNLVYLDTAERLLGKQMDCFKFRMDLKEITRLIDPIIEDVRSKNDICHNSMLIIKEAETDIEVLLTESQREANEEHKKAAKAAISAPRSADPFGTRSKSIHTKINHNDFVYPIEARYQIKWAQACMEQSIVQIEHDEKILSREVNGLNYEIEEASRLWDISSIAFNLQIYQLKNAITDRELAYDQYMEDADNKIQITRTRLATAKNDLEFYRQQIPMFHQRIAEVQMIKALQEQEALEAATASQRKSRKQSRQSPKAKAQKKKS